MIRLQCTEFERNAPELGDYLYVRVDVEDAGFCGYSNCVFSEGNWDGFLAELNQLAHGAAPSASLTAGWGDEVYFSLEFEQPDIRGHVWVSVVVAHPVRARVPVNPPVSHRLNFAYEIDLATLDRMLADAKGFKTGAALEVVGLPT